MKTNMATATGFGVEGLELGVTGHRKQVNNEDSWLGSYTASIRLVIIAAKLPNRASKL